jgi:hypothetical protein
LAGLTSFFPSRLLLTPFEGRAIFVDEVRMEFQADSERAPGSERKKKFLSLMAKLFPLILAALIIAACAPKSSDPLAGGFTSPPDSSRPWVYWMWMDGNLSREGITADLEAMKRAGLGGVIICEVNVGVPRGPVEFMSLEWRGLFKHVVKEAARLGLEVAINAGPGWTGSGGPWVTPEQSMQHLVASAVEVLGPKRFDGQLPRPERRPAFFGDGKLPAPLEKAKNEYYRDVAVLAFPTPAAGPRIQDIDEKALYVRAPYSSQAGVKPFLPAPADFPTLPPSTAIAISRLTDISSFLGADGRLSWDVPAGRWTIMRFGRTSNGANTRPAPVPGLGLECDKLDPAALDAHFDAFFGTLLREIGPHKTADGAGWTMLHIDSWEMGAQNWTGAFRDEFRRRRGYDLLRYLPALDGRVVDSLETSERFLWDLRQTAQELLVENHAEHLKDLGRREGFGLSIEPYDMTPCADMTLGTVADVPMGEFWLNGFDTAHSVIEAASLGHTNGKPVIAAEAFTSMSDEHWLAAPASMKALGDWAFAAGINRIVFHRYQHQPWTDVKPGMTMGPYGVHWERTQTWWDMVPAYHAYLSRCQFMLRQGLPVADICYLVAEGAPHVFRPPASALRGRPPDRLGYNFDGIAPETLIARASVKDGKLVFPDGMSYRLLVLPERETMTPALLRKVRDLVEAGATVVGPPPRKSPGLSGYPGCDDEVRTLAAEIWGDCDGEKVKGQAFGSPLARGLKPWASTAAFSTPGKPGASAAVTEHAFGKGRVVWVRDGGPKVAGELAASDERTWKVGLPPLSGPEQYGDFSIAAGILVRMDIPPDFESETRLRYAHRCDGDTDIYFVANPEDKKIEATCAFRVAGKRPELWDAVSGGIRDLPEYTTGGGRTVVPIKFEPHQSFFVVFRTAAPDEIRAGRNFADGVETVELRGPWEVSFDPKWGGPEKIVFPELEDWSLRPEEGIKYYSGIATYHKTFDLPDATTAAFKAAGKSRRGLRLDLGAVMNIARVALNGRDLGVVWCAPWDVDIDGVAKAKGNRLEVAVANLWPNRLIGDERQPPDAEYGRGGNLARWPDWFLKKEPRPSPGRFTFSTWKHFSKDSPLLPSGLLGPVTVRIE